jgi:hypothetical protein
MLHEPLFGVEQSVPYPQISARLTESILPTPCMAFDPSSSNGQTTFTPVA